MSDDKWASLTRRLAGVAGRECGQKGFAIITVEVLVQPDGTPALWTEPKVTKLEPRLGAHEFLTKVLQMMGAAQIDTS